MNKFNTFKQILLQNYSFTIKYKDQSLFMKLISYILFFLPTFMTNYITTIGSTIYYPSQTFVQRDEDDAIIVLAHEVVHVTQANKYGNFLFGLMYLFPQCFAALSLLSILAIVWTPFLWCLVFLVFLAPIPSPWRMKFEFEAYSMSLYMLDLVLRQYGYSDYQRINELKIFADKINAKQFKGTAYWLMWPFGVDFSSIINDIESGVISDTSETYNRMKTAYTKAVSG